MSIINSSTEVNEWTIMQIHLLLLVLLALFIALLVLLATLSCVHNSDSPCLNDTPIELSKNETSSNDL